MSPRFKAWKDRVVHLTEDEAGFEKWVFVHTAGVLFADKGGELLILNHGTWRMGVDRQLAVIERLSRLWRYSYVTLCSNSLRARVVVYDPSKMMNALAKIPRWVLREIDYDHDVRPGEFLKEMGRRWSAEERIPHEIAFALGYPVKDVLGFIGLLQLRCTRTCGWRVYGDPEPSLLKSRRYRRAREVAEAFVGISGRMNKVEVDIADNGGPRCGARKKSP